MSYFTFPSRYFVRYRFPPSYLGLGGGTPYIYTPLPGRRATGALIPSRRVNATFAYCNRHPKRPLKTLETTMALGLSTFTRGQPTARKNCPAMGLSPPRVGPGTAKFATVDEKRWGGLRAKTLRIRSITTSPPFRSTAVGAPTGPPIQFQNFDGNFCPELHRPPGRGFPPPPRS